jgi:O-antigen ligase
METRALLYGGRQWSKALAMALAIGFFALVDYIFFCLDLQVFLAVVAALGALILVLLRWPYGALTALFVASAMPHFTFQVFSWNAKPENFVVPLVALGVLARVALTQERLLLRAADWLLVAFVGVNYMGSSINSPQPQATLRWALQFTLAAASYFVTIHLVSNRERHRKAMKIFLIVGAAQVTYGLLCYASYRMFGTLAGIAPYSYVEDSPAIRGSLWEPNIFGGYAAAFSVMFFFYRLNAGPRWGRYTVGFLLASLALILSLARQGWIGFCVGLLFVFWCQVRRNRVTFRSLLSWVATVSIVALTLILIAVQGNEYLRGRLETMEHPAEAYTFTHRIIFNMAALDHARQHPWLGWGSSSFGLFWDWETPDGVAPAWTGNLEIRILHDTGVIGLGLFLVFIAKLLGGAFAALKQTTNADDLHTIGALVSGLLVLLVAFQATDATTLTFPWVHLGLLAGALRVIETRPNREMMKSTAASSL